MYKAWPGAFSSMLQDLLWKLVNMFTLTWMWAAAVHMCVQHANFEGGGETATKGEGGGEFLS